MRISYFKNRGIKLKIKKSNYIFKYLARKVLRFAQVRDERGTCNFLFKPYLSNKLMRDIKNFLCSFQVTYLRVHLSENSSSLKWGTFLLVRDRFIKSLFF